MLDFLVKFPDLLHSAIVFGTVIMFGALGEIITEKSGNLNLGVPGIMYFGEPQQARRRRRPGLRGRDLAGVPQLLLFPRQLL